MFEDNDRYFEEKNREEIVSRYEDLLRKKKPFFFDVDDFESIIEFYVEQNKFSSAFEATNIASGLFPSSPEIKLKKAQLLLDKGKPVEALSELKNALLHDSENFEIFLLLGITYLNLNNTKEAIRKFEECINFIPEDIKKDEILFSIGFHLGHTNRFALAIKYLNKSIEVNSQNLESLAEIAYCYDGVSNFNKCIEFYLKCIDINPFLEFNWYNLGLIYIKINNTKKAIEAFDYALAIDPEYLSAYLAKANLYLSLEKYTDAVDIYKEYLNYDTDFADVYYYIGECYEKLDKLETAIKYYDLTIEKDKNHSDAWLGKGVIKMYLEDYAGSLVCLTNSVLIDAENPEAQYSLAELYLKTGMYSEALPHVEIAIKVAPEEVDYILLQSELYQALGDFKKSIDVLEDGYFSIEEKAPILYRLAGLYISKDNNQKAAEYLKQAIEADSALIVDFLKIFPDAKDFAGFKGLLDLPNKKLKK